MNKKETNRRRLSQNHHRAVAGAPRKPLSRKEHQLERILELTTACFGVWRISSGQICFSDSWIEALGFSDVDSPKGHDFITSLIHPEDKPTLDAALQAHLMGKAPALDCEFRLRTKGGRYRWFQIRGNVVRRDTRNASVHLVGIVLDIHEDKQREEELENSCEQLSAILQAAPDCISVVDPVRFALISFNKAFEDLIFMASGIHVRRGMRPEDINPAAAEDWNEFYRQVLEMGAFAWDYQLHPAKVIHHVSAQCLVRDGQVQGICVFGHDVTDHRHTEEALQRSEEKFEKVFRESPLALFLASARDSRHIEVNDAYLETTGYSREELIGKTPNEVGLWVMPKHRVEDALQDVLRTGEVRNVEVMIRTKSGEIRQALGSGALIDCEGESCILGVILDITDRRRAAEAVRESEERLRIAIEAGHMYAFEWDFSTDALQLSEQSIGMLDLPDGGTRHTRQELIEKIQPEDRQKYMRAVEALSVEKPEYKVVFRMRLQSGKTIWLEESGRAIFGPEGKLRKVIGIASDATEVRQSERILRQLSGRLITSQEEERRRIARELHDNIGQEAALLCVLARRIDSGDADKEHTVNADVHELYSRIKALAGDISKLSHRLHSSELNLLGLKAAAERLCHDFEDQYHINIDLQVKSLPSALDGTKALCLYRVLQEALQNVAKHSHATKVVVETRIAKNELILEVKDNGTGFDVEKTGFESGLGLLSMQERLNLVGGHLAIVSRCGAGTTLTARLIV